MKTKLFLLLITCNSLWANLSLPAVFSDHMVLQRQSEVLIWGWGNPKEAIEITTGWDGKTYKTTASELATWSVSVKTPEAGGPYEILLKGYNQIKLSDVLIGEVWLCSGQSNMEMSAAWGITNGEAEMARATDSGIRLFNIPKRTADAPQLDLDATWQACSPETAKHFSAAAYFFAQRLREEMKDVPIGLVLSAWGGTPAEVWISSQGVSSNQEVTSEAAKRQPSEWCPHLPGKTYNAMIAPIRNFRFAGALWYQGESNVGSSVYDLTLSALISDWRHQFQSELPFFIVQIAPYANGETQSQSVAVVQDAQRRVAETVKQTGLVVISDVSTPDDIHPKDKKTVGMRLANLVMEEVYQIAGVRGKMPSVSEIKKEKRQLVISFKNADGLQFKGKSEAAFEVAGADGKFIEVPARVQSGKIILDTKAVAAPAQVRYSWKNDAKPVLFNADGLPVSVFLLKI